MPKKKKSAAPITGISAADIESQIEKDFGLNIGENTKNLIDKPKAVISISPKFDMILGGGVPEGSFVLVTGPKKTGKSVFSLQLASGAQKVLSEWGQRKIYYLDVEGRLKSRDIKGIKGLDADENFRVIRSEPGNILNGEKFLNIAERLINAVPGSVIIIDSFSSLCSEEEMANELGQRFRANMPQILGSWCRRISNVLAVNQNIVIGITHQIANTGPGHSTKTEASGNKIQYQSDVKIELSYCQPWTVGSEDKKVQIGQNVYTKCMWSAIGPPGGKAECKLRYGIGYDFAQEIADLAVDFGLVEKGGSWFTLSNGEKIQGAEKLRDYLVENPQVCDELNKELREMLGYEDNDTGRTSHKLESEGGQSSSGSEAEQIKASPTSKNTDSESVLNDEDSAGSIVSAIEE